MTFCGYKRDEEDEQYQTISCASFNVFLPKTNGKDKNDK
jgi:hypothetical protein